MWYLRGLLLVAACYAVVCGVALALTTEDLSKLNSYAVVDSVGEDLSKLNSYAVIEDTTEHVTNVKGFAVLNAIDERVYKIVGYAVVQGSQMAMAKEVGYAVLCEPPGTVACPAPGSGASGGMLLRGVGN